jgi:hypothetical protein
MRNAAEGLAVSLSLRPKRSELKMSDVQYRFGVAMLCREDRVVSLPRCSGSGHATRLDHAMACTKCVGSMWTRRHERVLHALTKVLRRFGICVTTGGISHAVTATGLIPVTGHTAGQDALVLSDTKTYAIDVTVRHRSTGTLNDASISARGQKLAKYKQVDEALGWTTVPVVLSSNSVILDRSLTELQKVCAGADLRGCRNELVAAMKIACVRGNADLFEVTGIQPDFGDAKMAWVESDPRGDGGDFDGESEEDEIDAPPEWAPTSDRRGIKPTPSQADTLRGRSASASTPKRTTSRARAKTPKN